MKSSLLKLITVDKPVLLVYNYRIETLETEGDIKMKKSNMIRNSNRNSKNCTCKPVFDELHWEWNHKSDCNCINNPDTFDEFDAEEQTRKDFESNRRTVLFHINNGTSYRCDQSMIMKYAPEEYAASIA